MEMFFLKPIYEEIVNTVGQKPSETGGILLGYRSDYIVRKFIFDPYGSTSSSGYDPDVNYLNKKLKEEWEKNQFQLLGFVHSHPRGVERLSGDYGNGIGDLGYLNRIFNAIPDLEKFYVPIVYSIADGKEYKIFPYIAFKKNIVQYKKAEIKFVSDNFESKGNNLSLDLTKLSHSVDINLMQKSYVVGIGCGGASNIYENLARTGLGKLLILDYDKVDPTNLTTQGYNQNQIGSYKTESLKSRILEVNPNIDVKILNKDFLQLTEDEIFKIFDKADLSLFMTDNFYAQARGNLVAIKYQIPAIFAMMYYRAKASEIAFTIPGVTPACFRCIVASRYKSYFENNYQNEVTSDGSTIFHTHYLNSVIGLLSLAIIHRKTIDLEFSNWFGDYWDKNFFQIRMHPNYSSETGKLFERTFRGLENIFNFDTVWQKCKPEEHPNECPDCKSLGNLLNSSKFIKTTNLNIKK